MARPNYRKRRSGSDVWHFCTTCTLWPTTDYETKTSSSAPSVGELCNQCLGKERNGDCK